MNIVKPSAPSSTPGLGQSPSEISTTTKSDEATHTIDRRTLLTSTRSSNEELFLPPADTQKRKVEGLPNEVLLAVFARVRFSEENWKAIRLTCRRFNNLMTEHSTSLVIAIASHQFYTAALLRQSSSKTPRWLSRLHKATSIVTTVAKIWERVDEVIMRGFIAGLDGSRVKEVVELGLHLIESLGEQPREEQERYMDTISDECCLLVSCAITFVACVTAALIQMKDPAMLFIDPDAGAEGGSYETETIHRGIRLGLLYGGLVPVAGFLFANTMPSRTPEEAQFRYKATTKTRVLLDIISFGEQIGLSELSADILELRILLHFEERLDEIVGEYEDIRRQSRCIMEHVGKWRVGATNLGDAFGGLTI
jgi:hypothetical protein